MAVASPAVSLAKQFAPYSEREASHLGELKLLMLGVESRGAATLFLDLLFFGTCSPQMGRS